jgi:hypothetical protein
MSTHLGGSFDYVFTHLDVFIEKSLDLAFNNELSTTNFGPP